MKHILKLGLLCLSLNAFSAADTAPSEWKKWVSEKQELLKPEFAGPTAQDLIHLKKDTEMFANPDGKGSYEYQTTEKPETVFSVKWDGANKLHIKHKGKSRVLKTKNKDGGIVFPQMIIQPGMAIDGFHAKGAPNITLFLFDSRREGIDAARKFEAFAYDPAFKVNAVFTPQKTPEKVKIVRTRGDAKEWTQVGVLNFKIGTKEESLKVFDNGSSSKELFLMFHDATNGAETYGGGRYLDVEIKKLISELKPGENLTLDFNYAYSPMCSRSKAFMCPVPHDRIVSKISAGEKKIH